MECELHPNVSFKSKAKDVNHLSTIYVANIFFYLSQALILFMVLFV